jgi:hypothetical protein
MVATKFAIESKENKGELRDELVKIIILLLLYYKEKTL